MPGFTPLPPLSTPLPTWPACWVQCTDRTRSSSSEMVKNIWDVYLQQLSSMPTRVREQLRQTCDSNDEDAAWRLWSCEAEACLIRAHQAAGRPALARADSIGRGKLSLCDRRLGGRRRYRIYRTDHADPVDVASALLHLSSHPSVPSEDEVCW